MTSTSAPARRRVFIAGSTGYMGRRLATRLLERGHEVHALARAGSERHVPAGASVVVGNALDGASYAGAIAPCDTFVHLVGVAHPSPSKAELFRSIDLASVQQSVPAAVAAGVRHFVYVSVAQPAPAMQAYVAARAEAERVIRDAGLDATILRPWYVLGPGHWWPLALLPAYWACELLPGTREGARRLGLVTLPQVLRALTAAVERPASGVIVVPVPEIRTARVAA